LDRIRLDNRSDPRRIEVRKTRRRMWNHPEPKPTAPNCNKHRSSGHEVWNTRDTRGTSAPAVRDCWTFDAHRQCTRTRHHEAQRCLRVPPPLHPKAPARRRKKREGHTHTHTHTHTHNETIHGYTLVFLLFAPMFLLGRMKPHVSTLTTCRADWRADDDFSRHK